MRPTSSNPSAYCGLCLSRSSAWSTSAWVRPMQQCADPRGTVTLTGGLVPRTQAQKNHKKLLNICIQYRFPADFIFWHWRVSVPILSPRSKCMFLPFQNPTHQLQRGFREWVLTSLSVDSFGGDEVALPAGESLPLSGKRLCPPWRVSLTHGSGAVVLAPDDNERTLALF